MARFRATQGVLLSDPFFNAIYLQQTRWTINHCGKSIYREIRTPKSYLISSRNVFHFFISNYKEEMVLSTFYEGRLQNRF